MQFEMPKDFDDVEGVVLLDEGIYELMLAVPPEKKENKAGTGYNIVLSFQVVNHPNPSFNGRTLMKWLPLPAPGDENDYTKMGQSKLDWKMENIKKAVEAMGGTAEGNSIDIPEGAVCRGHAVLAATRDGSGYMNQLDGDLQAA